MRKLLLTLALSMTAAAAHAIPLFPFFVDVAGDYNDGTPSAFEKQGISCMYWKAPAFYSNLDEAVMFLEDVLPYSSETITRTDREIGKKGKMVIYSSPMTAGRTSCLYLIQTPEDGFLAGYSETGE